MFNIFQKAVSDSENDIGLKIEIRCLISKNSLEKTIEAIVSKWLPWIFIGLTTGLTGAYTLGNQELPLVSNDHPYEANGHKENR